MNGLRSYFQYWVMEFWIAKYFNIISPPYQFGPWQLWVQLRIHVNLLEISLIFPSNPFWCPNHWLYNFAVCFLKIFKHVLYWFRGNCWIPTEWDLALLCLLRKFYRDVWLPSLSHFLLRWCTSNGYRPVSAHDGKDGHWLVTMVSFI